MKMTDIPSFVPAISLALRYQFNRKLITIRNVVNCKNRDDIGKSKYDDISGWDEIWIECYPTQLALLSDFGHHLKNLKISSFRYFSPEEIERIVELINLHCSERVKTVKINTDEKVFNKLYVPFEVAEEVSIMNGQEYCISSEFEFSKMFPAIRTLYMDSYHSLTSPRVNSTGYVMPNLTYIKRIKSDYARKTEVDLDETHFGNIIRNNPQINSFSTVDCNAKSLQFLSDHVPNLENLEFLSFDPKNDDDYTKIKFNKLKKLSMGGRLGKKLIMPRSFACENLEELTLWEKVEFEDIRNFIVGRMNLKKFHYNTFLTDELILFLARMNLIITEALLHYHSSIVINARNIVKFIENSRNLKELQIENSGDTEGFMRLRNNLLKVMPSLGDEWTMETRRDKVLVFQKTN